MKRVIILSLVLLSISSLAFAQAGYIGLYSDAGGGSCYLLDTPGICQVYVVHMDTPGATGSRFQVVSGGGFTGTYLSETQHFSSIGNTQTGITINYFSCIYSPVLLVTILYYCQGTSSPCSWLDVVPDPAEPLGTIVVWDCSLPPTQKLVGSGGRLYANPDGSCTDCGPPACQVHPTSIDFGLVQGGSFVDTTFTITHASSGGTLGGTVSESCPDYSIISNTNYSLAGGESTVVTIRFEPTAPGTFPCTINAGADTLCGDVFCTADVLFEYAFIDSIVDVPNDQGGWAYLYFTRSIYDFADEDSLPIEQYYLYRRIDDPAVLRAIKERGQSVDQRFNHEVSTGSGQKIPELLSEAQLVLLDNVYYYISRGVTTDGMPPGTWASVGVVQSLQQDHYIALVPTVADSSDTLIYSVYTISAQTTTPSIYFFSPPDSGYSVDNIAPQAPLGFSVAYNAGSNRLTWEACPDEDFHYFCIYRSEDEDFSPGPGNLAHTTTGTEWLDTIAEAWRYHYKMTAVDFSGNESDPVSPETKTAAPTPVIPDRFALYQNVPNPFNPTTVIHYDVPACGGKVTIKIYDVRGRFVFKLVDEVQSAGQKAAIWNGRDAKGHRVASGIYFCRMQAPDFVETCKMVLLQ